MTFDRATFLALCSALAGCRETPAGPAAPLSPSAPTVAVDVAPVASAASAPVPASASSPPCKSVVDVPACVDFGLPAPTCEAGLSPTADCQRLRGVLGPSAGRAAVACMFDRRGTCDAHGAGAASRCFLASLSSACETPGVRATCASIVKKCGKVLGEEECVAGISATTDEIRPRMISCVSEGCSVDCFDSWDLRSAAPPPKVLAKAPPPQSRAGALAQWPSVASPLPAPWRACRLQTDCTLVANFACGSIAVSQAFAPIVAERVRLEAKTVQNRHPRSCASTGRPVCEHGACAER